MKTTFILLATIFTFQINLLFAGSDGTSLNSNHAAPSKNILELAPRTPLVATFEEITPAAFTLLAPTTPAEATFGDEFDYLCMTNLAPVTPVEADFIDSPAQDAIISSLAPVNPSVATFEELN
jgi:hypothetical protein